MDPITCIAMLVTLPITAFLCIRRLKRNTTISFGTILLASCCAPFVVALILTCLMPDIWLGAGQKCGPPIAWVLLIVMVFECSLPASWIALYYQKRLTTEPASYARWIILFIISFIFTITAIVYVPGFIRSRRVSCMEACINNMRSLEVCGILIDLQSDDLCKKAIESFVRDQEAHGRFPLQVSLGELVASGYLSREQVKEYEKGDVIIVIAGDRKRPGIVGVRLRFPDGSEKAYFNRGDLQ